MYSGQNDIILGPPLTEQFLDKLPWDGAAAYATSKKIIWKIDSPEAANNPVAGYVKNVDKYSFTYAVVRGAGRKLLFLFLF